MIDIAQHIVDVITDHRARQPKPGSYLMSSAEVKNMVKQLGGVTKAARTLGCSRSSIYRWMKTGIKN